MFEIDKAAKPVKEPLSPDDYRLKLKARFFALKAKKPHLSIAVLARSVGCSSSFIKKLFAGRAHLGFRYAEKLSKHLELTAAEEEQLFLKVVLHSVEGDRFRDLMNRIISSSHGNEA